jgi:heme/copper-type cytochrome/quinol oxidase subunit 4
MDILYGVVGLAAIIGAIYYFIRFLNVPANSNDKGSLRIAIGAAVVACICALLYFLRHMNQEEEIHITE